MSGGSFVLAAGDLAAPWGGRFYPTLPSDVTADDWRARSEAWIARLAAWSGGVGGQVASPAAPRLRLVPRPEDRR